MLKKWCSRKDRGSNETLSKIERFSNWQKWCPGQWFYPCPIAMKLLLIIELSQNAVLLLKTNSISYLDVSLKFQHKEVKVSYFANNLRENKQSLSLNMYTSNLIFLKFVINERIIKFQLKLLRSSVQCCLYLYASKLWRMSLFAFLESNPSL